MRLRPTLAGVLLLLGTLTDALLAQQALRLTEVGPGVYAVRPRLMGANAAVVVGDDAVLVVDTHATPVVAREVAAAIAELTDKPVRWVVNTHWHTDHTAGNAAYEQAWPDGVTFLSHHTTREDIAALASGQMGLTASYTGRAVERVSGWLAAGVGPEGAPLSEHDREVMQRFVDDQRALLPTMTGQPFELPDVTFERALTLHLGARVVHVLHLGKGHTRGDVVVFLPEGSIAITGDLLTHPMLYVSENSWPAAWQGSLEALAALEPAVVVPGHGEVQQGSAHLELMRTLLAAAVDAARQSLDDDLSYQDAIAAFDIDALRARVVGDDESLGEAFDAARPFLREALGQARRELTGQLTR